jgi:hypothetical protein
MARILRKIYIERETKVRFNVHASTNSTENDHLFLAPSAKLILNN